MSMYVETGYAEQGYMEGQYPFEIGDQVVIENFIAKSNMTMQQRIQDITTQLSDLIEADGLDRIGVLYDPLAKRTMMIKGGNVADVGGYMDPAVIEQQVQSEINEYTATLSAEVQNHKTELTNQVTQEIDQRLANLSLTMNAVLPDGTVAAQCSVTKQDDSTFTIDVPTELQGKDYDLVVNVESGTDGGA